MTGLSVLQSVYKLLKENNELTKVVSNRFFPLIAKENTPYPFIIYQRNSLQPIYCKDGLANDTVTISITIVSANYTESIDIAEMVRNILECKRVDSIKSIRLVSSNEDFMEDAFTQELQFEIIY